MTSFAGQWISQLGDSNSNVAVIDIDLYRTQYIITAIAWSGQANMPSILLSATAPANNNNISVQNLSVNYLNLSGDLVDSDILSAWQISNNLSLPPSMSIDLHQSGNKLFFKWATPIGTSGSGVATRRYPNTNKRYKMPLRKLKWSSAKSFFGSVEKEKYLFRGQADSQWKLQSSFHRAGRYNFERYLKSDAPELARLFSSITEHRFDTSDPLSHASLLYLAQHHGYPTPLLDWSWSPYVAAFFCFRNLPKQPQGGPKYVRIFMLDHESWIRLPQADKLFVAQPNLSVIQPLALGNTRAIPQQALSTFSNIDDIEGYLAAISTIREKNFLTAIDIPSSERNVVMSDLALMGITAGSLFPGLDGVCESLRERNF